MRRILATALFLILGLLDPVSAQVSNQAYNPKVLPSFYMNWGTNNGIGFGYPFAASINTVTVFTPNGNAPTQGDLGSQRYNHHNQNVIDSSGRAWEAHSSGGTNEDAGGQMTVVHSSADGWNTQTGPVLVVPPQSTYSGTGASDTPGTLVSYPRKFVTYNSQLYLVAAVDGFSSSVQQIGMALLAVPCNPDGTIGTLIRISAAAYTPQVGTTPAYDPVLGPQLFAVANLYGTWGGSYPGQPASAWIGFLQQGSNIFVEPATIPIDAAAQSLTRLWRQNNGTGAFVWEQDSNDGGNTWSALQQTNIFNAPSAMAGLRLSDGRMLLVGNPVNFPVSRDPLYVAVFNNGTAGNVYAIQKGLSGVPVYSGTSKGGGAQYPGITINGSTVWVSYDIAKESVYLSSIPLSSLNFLLKRDLDPASNDNDPMWLEKAA